MGRLLCKVPTYQTTLILITPLLQTQLWYPQLIQMFVEKSLLPRANNLLIGSNGEKHHLIKNEACNSWHGPFQGKAICKRNFSRSFLIVNAQKSGANSHYELNCQKWGSWCAGRKTNSIKIPLTSGLEFLTYFS